MFEIADLRRVLRYEPDTGKLFWLPRPAVMFADGDHSAAHTANSWNVRFSGKEAFTSTHKGYRQGHVFGKLHRAHRVIWALHYGEWPSLEIDHVNGVRDDNRIDNLRLATAAENTRNAARPKNNTTGIVGVYRVKKSKNWMARITVDYRIIHIGHFDTFENAVAARKAAEARYGFHENHGRAA